MKVENGVSGSPFNQQVSAREEKRSYLGICWFLDQGITQWCYVYLISRFVLRQEKTPEFESACDKAEIWGFRFLIWLRSCLSETIKLFWTVFFFLSMKHQKRGSGKGTQEVLNLGTEEARINGREEHLSFFIKSDRYLLYYLHLSGLSDM